MNPDHECPLCGGPPTLLGALGHRLHYRCRNCGMSWSRKREIRLGELMSRPGQAREEAGRDKQESEHDD